MAVQNTHLCWLSATWTTLVESIASLAMDFNLSQYELMSTVGHPSQRIISVLSSENEWLHCGTISQTAYSLTQAYSLRQPTIIYMHSSHGIFHIRKAHS